MDKFRGFWVRAAHALALLSTVTFFAASLATKIKQLDWRGGFGQLTIEYGQLLLMGVAVLALIALLLAFFTPQRRGAGASTPVCDWTY
jgi:hypothetical protein